MHQINIQKSKSLQYGIDVNKLKFGTVLLAKTRNSLYKIVKKEITVLFQGGKHFLEPQEVIFLGSNFGGSMLKLGWIGYGMGMEVVIEDKIFRTTSVKAVRIVGAGWEYNMDWR